MIHREMMWKYLVHPFWEGLRGTFDYIYAKLFLIAGGLPAFLALDLFSTPAVWWKALVWLVIIDWASGAVNAAFRSQFDWNRFVEKFYHMTAYLAVGGAAAVAANSIPEVFYYFQYLVYVGFIAKEFVSILKTWRLLNFFKSLWSLLTTGKFSIESFDEVRSEMKRRRNEADSNE